MIVLSTFFSSKELQQTPQKLSEILNECKFTNATTVGGVPPQR